MLLAIIREAPVAGTIVMGVARTVGYLNMLDVEE